VPATHPLKLHITTIGSSRKSAKSSWSTFSERWNGILRRPLHRLQGRPAICYSLIPRALID
jgi:hypothetical protein